jgi:hypothetical protein
LPVAEIGRDHGAGSKGQIELVPMALRQDTVGETWAELKQEIEIAHTLTSVIVIRIDRKRCVQAEVELDPFLVSHDPADGAAITQAQHVATIDGKGKDKAAEMVLVGCRIIGEIAATANNAHFPEWLVVRRFFVCIGEPGTRGAQENRYKHQNDE